MSRARRPLLPILIAGAALVGLAGLLPDAARGPVDWRAARVVVFESDDWGLCGFFPDAPPDSPTARAALGGGFPPAYWQSTLEDSAGVAALAAVLAAGRGRDGLSPVLQANMIVSALWVPDAGADAWARVDIPDLPPAYARPGLWRAVDDAIARGVWRPEFHGTYHYDPARRQAARAAAAAPLRDLLARTVLFPGSARAWELGAWREESALAAELDHSIAVFAARFGRVPVSVCAPDYVWDARCERLWAARGLTVIQAKREQRDPRARGGGLAARARKLLARAGDRWLHPGRICLERNCRFEPAQSADSNATLVACLRAVHQAWAAGRPAVVETHRINFVSLAPGEAARGRRQLGRLLASLATEPGGAPLYLTDDELAQLERTGTSWTLRGPLLVARNLTQGVRLAPLPAAGTAPARLLPLGPGMTVAWPMKDVDPPN